jgi:DNA-binding NarL/FixJ family response regulator
MWMTNGQAGTFNCIDDDGWNMVVTVETTNDQEALVAAQLALSQAVAAIVTPILEKLKAADVDPLQTGRLIGILEANLQHLMQAYGSSTRLAAVYMQLTPVETLVASMVRQGLSSHDIAEALNIASGTVGIHRKHIRKKLGLDGKATNLQSYLLSLIQ